MKQSQASLSESQVIKIATDHVARLGFKDFYIDFANYSSNSYVEEDEENPFDGGYWNVPVGFEDESKKWPGVGYVQVDDKTGKIHDPPFVSQSLRKYMEAEENARLTETQAVEIARRHAIRHGLKGGQILTAHLDKGYWHASVVWDDELNGAVIYFGGNVTIKINDETGEVDLLKKN